MVTARRHEPTAEELEILRKLNAAVHFERRREAARSAIDGSPQIQSSIRTLAAVAGCAASEVKEMLVSAVASFGAPR